MSWRSATTTLLLVAAANCTHAEKLVITAKAVADLQLRSTSSANSSEIDLVSTVGSKALTSADARALDENIPVFLTDILVALDLRALPSAYVFANDEQRPGFSAIDGELPEAVWKAKHSGIVVIGSAFTARLLTKTNGRSDASGIAVALAHEVAHIYQFRTGYWTRLLSIEANQSRRRAELHADFIAGWLSARLGYRKLSDIDVKSRQLFDLGDQDTMDPNHHGTPSQRYAAMLRGFFLGISEPNAKISTVAAEGEVFVNSLVPLPAER